MIIKNSVYKELIRLKIHIKIILPIIVILFLLILLVGCLPGLLTPPTPKGVITGRVMVPSSETAKDVTGWIPVANATVTLTDSEGVTHTVTTNEDGYYTFTDITVNANTIITATATIDGNTVIIKDIIPQAVAATEDYDAGTADAESTALGLIVEELLEQGLDPEDINLEEIQDSDNFTEVVEQVSSILEENGNVTTDPGVTETVSDAAEEIISPPVYTPPEDVPTPPVTPTPTPAAELTGIKVSPDTMTLLLEETQPLTVIANYSDGTSDGITTDCTYLSSNVDIAEVDATGLVTAIDFGKTTIGVSYTPDGEVFTDTVEVTVGPVHNKTQDFYRNTIQDAIDDALTLAGDTIEVAAGTYEESVIVNKSLTLLGAKADVDPRSEAWTGDITTINAGLKKNGILVTASDVTINGFKVMGSGTPGQVIDSESGIYVFNESSQLTGIVIKNCWGDANYGSGITLRFVLNPTVEYCYFSRNGIGGSSNIAGIAGQKLTSGSIINNECFNNTNYGIYLGCGGSTIGSGLGDTRDTVVSNNELHSNGKYGIQIIGIYGNFVENITVKDNDIHDNEKNGMKITNATACVIDGNQFTSNGYGALATEEKYKYGVMLSGYSYGIPAEDNLFTDNTFSGNSKGGVYMYSASGDPPASLAGTVFHFNNFIEGADKWGINNTSIYLVDAINNWWGHTSGPSGLVADPATPGEFANGSGDEVSSDVIFYPWSPNSN